MKTGPGGVAGFFLRVLLWLVPALALWYWARNYVVMPSGWLAGQATLLAFPRWVEGAAIEGTRQVLQTRLPMIDPAGRLGDLICEVDGIGYCYGMPLLAALLLASRPAALWWKLPAGLVALVPFQAFGISFAWLLQIAVTAADQTRLHTQFGPFAANLIVAGYQLGFLILPTLAPVFIWLALDRKVLAEVMIEGALRGLPRG